MDTIFKNYENSKSSDSRRLLVNLPEEKIWKRNDKHVALSHLSINYTWEKNYTKLKISATTLNEKNESLDELYSVPGI